MSLRWGIAVDCDATDPCIFTPLSFSQGYRNFYDRYRGDYDRFYGRDYEYNRYRDYYRHQYTRDVSIVWEWRDEGAGRTEGGVACLSVLSPLCLHVTGSPLSSSGRITTTTIPRTETDTTGTTTVTKGLGEAPAIVACQPRS